MVSFHDMSGGCEGLEFDEDVAKAIVHQIVAMTAHIRRMNDLKDMKGHTPKSTRVVDDVIEICELQITALREVFARVCGSQEKSEQVFASISDPISQVILTLRCQNN